MILEIEPSAAPAAQPFERGVVRIWAQEGGWRALPDRYTLDQATLIAIGARAACNRRCRVEWAADHASEPVAL